MAITDLKATWEKFRADRDPNSREALVLRYAYLVSITAGRVVSNLPPNLEREDLESAGVMGLIKAVDQFDPGRLVKFETYAIALIRGAILEMLREEDWVPRSIRDRTKLLERTFQAIEGRLGRPATENEMAQELDLTLDGYYKLLSDAARSSLLSLDEILVGGEGNETSVTLGETVADRNVNTFSQVEVATKKQLLAAAIDRLPPRERFVIALYYYDRLTFREIGKVLEISESRAYQLHTQAIVRVRAALTTQVSLFTGSEAEA
ncbi:MAG TPA: FliA/WhiG family RNA polymerase sigma factor [Armatimonadota bacterium]